MCFTPLGSLLSRPPIDVISDAYAKARVPGKAATWGFRGRPPKPHKGDCDHAQRRGPSGPAYEGNATSAQELEDSAVMIQCSSPTHPPQLGTRVYIDVRPPPCAACGLDASCS